MKLFFTYTFKGKTKKNMQLKVKCVFTNFNILLGWLFCIRYKYILIKKIQLVSIPLKAIDKNYLSSINKQ